MEETVQTKNEMNKNTKAGWQFMKSEVIIFS